MPQRSKQPLSLPCSPPNHTWDHNNLLGLGVKLLHALDRFAWLNPKSRRALGPLFGKDPLGFLNRCLRFSITRLGILAFGALVDRALWMTGSVRRSRVLPVAALLILGAIFLYLAVSVPSTLGSVTFFILAATAGAAIPCWRLPCWM